ncbi:response regulator transcription factor [Tepidibacter hydrothermalis]|uniref:Stage 0 sporulation protein A homolog n=1 Tax=Tepidibacter hydrothermalis TaxID=3036126 RepID=A0ABY8EFP4_9FIRM|nr:response regulator transcription factor [Tepidibacter hydrothermalis]WFD11767.1 response regulator transcription factor [Tepidibacter hydrothermalis]
MQKNVLVVEDESKMREFISLYLRKEGYRVIEAYNGEVAVEKFKENKIDLIVLDVMMPKLNGFEVCKIIREKSTVPIIILTAIEKEMDQIKGYELGADDYVTKPFKAKILIAKIKRLFERLREENDKKVYIYNKFKIDLDGREVFINGRKIRLAPKEFELLEFLVINKGIALTRNKILENVWGYDFEGETRVVDNHIKKLRNKLENYSIFIETVISVGYKFEVNEYA